MAATITKINIINPMGQMDATIFANSRKKWQNNADNNHHSKIYATIKVAETDEEQLKDVGREILINTQHHDKLSFTSLQPAMFTCRILLTTKRLNLSMILIHNLT